MTSTDDRHTPELTGVIYGADGAPRAGLLSNCATPWRMSVVVTSVTMWSQLPLTLETPIVPHRII